MIKKISNTRKSYLYKDAKSKAELVRNKFLLNKEPIGDMYAFAERHNFLIVSFPCLEDKFSGFFAMRSNIKCMYINSNHSLGKQNYSIAHEIYHSVYDTDKTSICLDSEITYNENEYLADSFASHFLMPEETVIKAIEIYNAKPNNINDIIHLQHYFKVSLTAMIIKLCKIGFINYFESQRLLSYASLDKKKYLQNLTQKMGYDINLISSTTPYVPESFIQQIEKNYIDGKVSKEKKMELELIIKSIKEGQIYINE